MQKTLAAALVGLTLCGSAGAAPISDGPDLPIRFVNAISDICFRTVGGHPPTNENADALGLEPAANIPATVKTHYYRVTSWFGLKSEPNSILVGIGDRTNCHLVLANSVRTNEVQAKVETLLSIDGSKTLPGSAPNAPVTDRLFAKEVPDGYMLFSIQAPRDSVRGGEGDQGAVHVSLMPKAMFEAMIAKHGSE